MSRTVTLVVNEPRGALPPFEVAVPWWQEVAPVAATAREAYGVDVTVLRLLHAAGSFPGGEVTYLVEAPEVEPDLLSPTAFEPADDPNRAHFAQPGAPSRLLGWATSALRDASIEVTGPPTQHRSWNLAATWTIPTSAGLVWLKATPRFLAHEAAVLAHLQPTGLVPPLIAGQPGRALMHHVDGVDGYGIGPTTMVQGVDALLDLQEAAQPTALHSVPRTGLAELAAGLNHLGDRWSSALQPDDRRRLVVLADELADRHRAVAHLGQTLVHADFHGGNIRLGADERPTVLDWGDSFIGCPLFDVYALDSYEVDGAEAIRGHWLDRLGASDDHWAAFRPVAAILLPLVYQRFCDNIEGAELAYHRDDVLPALEASLRALDPGP